VNQNVYIHEIETMVDALIYRLAVSGALVLTPNLGLYRTHSRRTLLSVSIDLFW